MGDVMVAITRPLRDWRRLLIGSLLAPIPIANLLVGGYALRCALTFRELPYQLPPWRPLGPLFRDGLVVTMLSVLSLIPAALAVKLLATFGLATESDVRFLLLFPLAYIIFIALALPSAALHFARTTDLGRSLNIPHLYHTILTSHYLRQWVVASLAAAAVMICSALLAILFAFTIVGPILLLGAGSVVGSTAYFSLLYDPTRD